jgi:hypothetical protein
MEPKLEQAVQAIKTGDKAAGLVLLAQVIRTDPNNESAWIWMATAQDDPEKKKQCLERVLRINPANERVRRALTMMFPAPVQPEAVPEAIQAAPQPAPFVEEQPSSQTEQPAAEIVPAVVSEMPGAFEPVPVETPQEAEAQPEIAPQPAAAEVSAAPVAVEPSPLEAAPPDLSWLKETSSSPAAPKNEASDLTWLKEDLPAESLAEEGYKEFETAQPEPVQPAWLEEVMLPAENEVKKEEPAPDLSWLKEDQPAAEAEFIWPDETKVQEAGAEALWQNEEQPSAKAEEKETTLSPTPTAETDDLAWLRATSSGPTGQPAAAPAESEEPDFSWLRSEPASEEKPADQPFNEAVFPWLNEAPGVAEAPAVMNDAESIPDWLRQGAGQAPEPSVAAEPAAPGPALPGAEKQEPATLESEPLTSEDFDAITSKRAELPFSWDEVTGEPVIKSPEKTISAPFADAPGAQTSQPFEASLSSTDRSAAAPSKAGSTPISRPISTPAAVVKPAQKKGLTGGQIILLGLFGLVCLIAVLAAGLYFAYTAGWLKAFGF